MYHTRRPRCARPLSLVRVLLCTGFALALCHLRAQESVTVSIERAASTAGPWQQVDLNSVAKDAMGNPRFTVGDQGFFRARIDLDDSGGLGVPLRLRDVPEVFVERAKKLIQSKLEQEEADPEGWGDDVQLADEVQVHETVLADGTFGPAYFEFKVVRNPPEIPDDSEFRLTHPDRLDSLDAGFILLSATEGDFPIAEWATAGPTNFELLARRAGTTRIRIARYGPTFYVAENERGEMIGSLGTAPYGLAPGLFLIDGMEWNGDDELGIDEEPREVPNLDGYGYANYEEFKMDVAGNAVYRRLREFRADRARPHWDVTRGVFPEPVSLGIGDSILLMEGELSLSTAYQFVSEDDAEIRVTFPRQTGGAAIFAAAPGEGYLRIRIGELEKEIYLTIGRTADPRQPAQSVSETWTYAYAGTWQMQPRYYQYERPEWCRLTGCGPVAWAILFAWFDINRGVEHAFRGEGFGQDPPMTLNSYSNRMRVLKAYDELHDYCNVICSPFSQQGGTWPTSMTSAFKTYTWPPAIVHALRRGWSTRATTGRWPDEGALPSRDAILNGRPAVTGLGWMWHYVVAYGYAFHQAKVGNFTHNTRYIKCNMGWQNVEPRWYNLIDTFYSANVRLWNGPSMGSYPAN
jgi:hypothetical protein